MKKFSIRFSVILVSLLWVNLLCAQFSITQTIVPANFSVCSDNFNFQVTITNTSGANLSNVKVSIKLHGGVEYVSGSVSCPEETVGYMFSPADSPVFNVSSVWDNSSTIHINYSCKSTCDAVPWVLGGNYFYNTIYVAATGYAIKVQNLTPVNTYQAVYPSILFVTPFPANQTVNHLQTFTTNVCVKNVGLGKANRLVITDLKNNANWQSISSNKGTVSVLSANKHKITITGTDLGPTGYLEKDSTVCIILTYQFDPCVTNFNSVYNAYWGCDQIPPGCDSVPITKSASYSQNLPVSSATVSFNYSNMNSWCNNGSALPYRWGYAYITNTGQDNIEDIIFNLQVAGPHVAFVPGSFQYSINDTVGWTNVSPVSTNSTASWIYNSCYYQYYEPANADDGTCFTGTPIKTAFFTNTNTFPTLLPGQYIVIKYKENICTNFPTDCSKRGFCAGSILVTDGSFKNTCNGTYYFSSQSNNHSLTLNQFYYNGFPTSASQPTTNYSGNLLIDDLNLVNVPSLANAKMRIKITLNCLTHNLTAANCTLRVVDQFNNTIATHNNTYFAITGNVVEADFNAAAVAALVSNGNNSLQLLYIITTPACANTCGGIGMNAEIAIHPNNTTCPNTSFVMACASHSTYLDPCVCDPCGCYPCDSNCNPCACNPCDMTCIDSKAQICACNCGFVGTIDSLGITVPVNCPQWLSDTCGCWSIATNYCNCWADCSYWSYQLCNYAHIDSCGCNVCYTGCPQNLQDSLYCGLIGCIGLTQEVQEIERITFGVQDFVSNIDATSDGINDNNIKVNKNTPGIATNVAFWGDTIQVNVKGLVRAGGASYHPDFAHAYLYTTFNIGGMMMFPPDTILAYVSATAIIYDQSANATFTCTNLDWNFQMPWMGGGHIFSFDLSPNVLDNNCASIPAGFTYTTGDSLIVKVKYRVKRNPGPAGINCTWWPNVYSDFYVSDVTTNIDSTNMNDMYRCNYLQDLFHFAGIDHSEYQSHARVKCDTVQSAYTWDLHPTDGYCTPCYYFPNEYRNFIVLDSIVYYNYSPYVVDKSRSFLTMSWYAEYAGGGWGMYYGCDQDTIGLNNFAGSNYIISGNKVKIKLGSALTRVIQPGLGVNSLTLDELQTIGLVLNVWKPDTQCVNTNYTSSAKLYWHLAPALAPVQAYTEPDNVLSPIELQSGNVTLYDDPHACIWGSWWGGDTVHNVFPQVEWNVTFNATSFQDGVSWIRFYSPSGNIVIDSIKNGMQTILPVNGYFPLGNTSYAYLTIYGTSNVCSLDSILVYGATSSCSGNYPPSGNYPHCSEDCVKKLFVKPWIPLMQTDLYEVTPGDSGALCTDFTFQVIVRNTSNASLARIMNIILKLYMPVDGTLEFIAGSGRVRYPNKAAQAWQAIGNPTASGNVLTWNISQLFWNNLGWRGLESPADPYGGTHDSTECLIEFKMRPNCGFIDGNIFECKVSAVGPCLNPLSAPIALQPNPPIHITGMNPPTEIANDQSINYINPCGSPLINFHQVLVLPTTSGNQPTGNNDSIFVDLPPGFSYVNNTAIGVNNFPNLGSAPGIISNPVITTYSGGIRLKWKLPANVQPGENITFDFSVTYNSSNVSCGNLYPLVTHTVRSTTAYCVSTNSNCTAYASTSAAEIYNFQIQKPILNFVSFNGSIIPGATPVANVSWDIVNSGAAIPAGTTTSIDFYCDNDNTTGYSAGDLLLATTTTTQAINTNGHWIGSGTFNMNNACDQPWELYAVIRQASATAQCLCNDSWEFFNYQILPITLLSFYGEALDKVNALYWDALAAPGCETQQVYKTTNTTSGDWSLVGEADCLFSMQVEHYMLIDEHPANIEYYRLKIIDNDGSFQYSNVIRIDRTQSSGFDLIAYPNPTESIVNILANEDCEVEVYNFLGIRMLKAEAIAGSAYPINMQKFSKGIYFIKGTKHQGESKTIRVVVVD